VNVGTTYSVRRFHDPVAFLNRAGPWLLQNEAENNLIIGIAQQLAAGTLLSGKPVYLATVECDGAVVGAAFRTPPYKLGITRMPAAAVQVLMHDAADVYDTIPAVLGDHDTARRAAECWAAAHTMQATAGMRHRIYRLDRLVQPVHPARGQARNATQVDVALVAQWIHAFSTEANIHTDNAERLAAARIKQHALYLWEDDGEVVSMAAWSGETPHGRRVGYVYTPNQHRRRGYATSLVAHVSAQILEDGCTMCFLYTDLSNQTSNSIYQQIGYRPVCDVMDWNIHPVSEVK
jgi:GNAT superfamily N-acetyltransferase